MFLNFFIIGLVALIAYWWANQGLFSAILHLLCTIAAGAIALGLWEWVVVRFILSGSQFDQYAWGLILVALFVVSLVTLRMACDKIVRANVNIPHMYNLLCGLPVGAASGILTIGILMIACGFTGSTSDLMGFTGVARSTKNGQVETSETLWVPVHTWTAQFYSYLSATSLYTSAPMAELNPKLDEMAGSLFRDGYKDGRSALTMLPAAVEIKSLLYCRDEGRWAVQVHFAGKAMDFGDRLTISAAQIRLIGDAKGTSDAPIEYPNAWSTSQGSFHFDDATHYITSVPGQQQADATIEFPAKAVKGNAKYIQIKGTRFRLPKMQESCDFGVGENTQAVDVTSLDNSEAGEIAGEDIRITNRLPIQMSKNQLPTGLTEQNGLLIEGNAEVDKSTLGGGISSQLKVQGVVEPEGTRVVQVNVSRHGSADIFSRIRQEVADDAKIQLVDNQGNTYLPVGYIYESGDKVTIDLRPGTYIRSYRDLPTPPSSGSQKLNLVFRITENVTLVALKVGDKVAGTCNMLVSPKKK